MSETVKIPQWALDRVHALTGAFWNEEVVANHTISRAFARYIAQHEEPPVDPMLRRAREIAAQVWYDYHPEGKAHELTLDGEMDDGPAVKAALMALREGMGDE